MFSIIKHEEHCEAQIVLIKFQLWLICSQQIFTQLQWSCHPTTHHTCTTSVCNLTSHTIIVEMFPKLLFNQIHSSLPHPFLWQWRMAAFTRLSPLHISLPIRLTTRIHTHRLSIPSLPNSSSLSLFPAVSQPFHHLVHSSPIFFHCLSHSWPFFAVRFHIQHRYLLFPTMSLHSGY